MAIRVFLTVALYIGFITHGDAGTKSSSNTSSVAVFVAPSTLRPTGEIDKNTMDNNRRTEISTEDDNDASTKTPLATVKRGAVKDRSKVPINTHKPTISGTQSAITNRVDTSPTMSTIPNTVDTSPTMSTIPNTVDTSPTMSTIPNTVDTSPTMSTITNKVDTSPTMSTIPNTVYTSPTMSTIINTVVTSPTMSTASFSPDVSSKTLKTDSTTTTTANTITVPSIKTVKNDSNAAYKPQLDSATYELSFTLRLQRYYSDIADNETAKRELKETVIIALKATVFNNISVTITVEFSQGSTKVDYTATILQAVEEFSLNQTLDEIKNNSATNLKSLTDTFSDLFEKEFKEDIHNTTAKMMTQNPCDLIKGACSASYDFICEHGNISSGLCRHKCDNDTSYCGTNGECFYDLRDDTKSCRCETNTFRVYYGPQCEESTATLTFVLALSLGIGGALLIFICIAMFYIQRRNRNGDQSQTIRASANPGGEPSTELTMRGPGLREADNNGQSYGRYRNEDHVYDQLFGRSERSTNCLPENAEIRTGPSGDNMSLYASIGTITNYSTEGPKVSAQPYQTHSNLGYIERHPDYYDYPNMRKDITDKKAPRW